MNHASFHPAAVHRRAPRAVGRAATAALLAVTTLVLAACGSATGHSGRELKPVPEGETAPPRRTSTTYQASSTTSAGLNLSSSAIGPGGRLPTEYTCNGAGISPPLTWSGVPADAKSLALVVTDDDDEGAVHWIIVSIPTTATSIAKGTAPAGTQLTNSFGTQGWKAPCTEATHTYEFNLLAFTDPPSVEGVTDPKQAVATLQQTSSASAIFSAKFGGATAGTGSR